MHAAVLGDVTALHRLISLGSNIHDLDNYGGNALIAASNSGKVDAVKFLLENGANVNENNGGTALMDASGSGYHDIVALLLENGANVDEKCTNDGQMFYLFYCYSPSFLRHHSVITIRANCSDVRC